MTSNATGSTFSMTSEAEHLLRLRKWLREELIGHGVPKQEQPNLLLAVGELCANSIQHAYGGKGGQPIKVSVRSSDESLVIEVEDFGKPFADSLSIDVAREHGTLWTMVKYRAGHGPAAASGGART